MLQAFSAHNEIVSKAGLPVPAFLSAVAWRNASSATEHSKLTCLEDKHELFCTLVLTTLATQRQSRPARV